MGFKFQFEIRGFLSGQDGLERGIEGRDRSGQEEWFSRRDSTRRGKFGV